ncbi:MAG: hypothetical protein FWH41_10550 [Treponema sp.]|nr:hypothetical protein [Treponema sp.]MCL2139952.1 hypothetical protein [Treponema sp.]
MENIIRLKDYVPFFQTVSWIFFVSIVFFIYRSSIKDLIKDFSERIKKGSSLKVGPFEIGGDLTSLQSADIMLNNIKESTNGDEREKNRIKIYKINKGLFLTHILVPSKKFGYYDIYIYLIEHKSKNYSEIKYAEFFFGHVWNNKIFRIKNENKLIGIIASANFPFLCTCHVIFKDGTGIDLYRYIDFETKRKDIPDI